MDFRVKDPLSLTELDMENIENSCNALAALMGVDHWFTMTVDYGDGTGAFGYDTHLQPELPMVFDLAVDLIIDTVVDEYGLARSPALT